MIFSKDAGTEVKIEEEEYTIVSQKDIEEELNIRSASVSTLLKKTEARDFIRREKVSCDDRLKKILSIRHTVEMKEQVERHITLLEKRLTAGIGAEELEIYSDVLKKCRRIWS